MKSLVGRTALVTGGGRGLGECICRVLGEAGMKVAVLDVRQDLARGVVQSLQAAGVQSMALAVDLSQEEQVASAVQHVAERMGSLDVLVNNAAMDVTVSLEQLTVEDWDHIVSVNLRGPFLTSRCAFPIMRGQQGGHIVNIVSTASRRAWANACAYHATKWGLLGFSHAIHVEGRPLGIKVTAVLSGGMRTPFLLDRFPDLDPGLLQDPRTVAETVRFVLSQPDETVIPEIMVIPMRETSWP